MTSTVVYKGNLRTELTHLQSKSIIENDAPTDNMGKGERFSPTDMVATALGSCMLTTMGIVADRWQIDLRETKVEITKIMAAEPRRIGEIIAAFYFSKTLQLTDEQKIKLERTAHTCPVEKSLHPDVKLSISFNY